MATPLKDLCLSLDVTQIRRYRQGEDEAMLQQDILEDGACLAICCEWLKAKKNRQDFWTKFDSGEILNSIYKVMAHQSLAGKMGGQSNPLSTSQQALSRGGLKPRNSVIGGAMGASSTSGSTVFATMTREQSPYNLVSLAGRAGSHVVAYVNTPFEQSFFDPNRGEFEFESAASLGQWLPKYCEILRYQSRGLLEAIVVEPCD